MVIFDTTHPNTKCTNEMLKRTKLSCTYITHNICHLPLLLLFSLAILIQRPLAFQRMCKMTSRKLSPQHQSCKHSNNTCMLMITFAYVADWFITSNCFLQILPYQPIDIFKMNMHTMLVRSNNQGRLRYNMTAISIVH